MDNAIHRINRYPAEQNKPRYPLVSDYLVDIGVRAGGEGGCSPPSYRNFWKFSGKTLMIRAKVFGRKYSKRLSKPDLKVTFSDVCLVKMESKVKGSKDPGICFGKSIYIVCMCIVESTRWILLPSIKQGHNQKQTKTNNLGQNLLRHITKVLIFALTLTKNAYSRKLKRPFPPSSVAMLFTTTEEMHTWAVKPKQHCTMGGEGDEFVLFDTMVAWREMKTSLKCLNTCPGL